MVLLFGHAHPAAQSVLVAAYSFNEGIGTSVADASGTGNTGSVANATWTAAGKYGGALSFNGSSTLVTIPDAASLHLTTAMTLEAWVNPSVITSGWRDLVYKGTDNYYLEATSSTNLPAAGATLGSTGAETFGTAALGVNTWTHLAETYDGTTLRLYVNGTQISGLARTGLIATSTNPLQIGGDSIWGQFFGGLIDEVRVYNVALTAAQILTDMNTPITVGTPLPDLTVAKTHAGAFMQAQAGANYTLTVSNAGTLPTNGTVTVVDMLPSGLTATAIAGTGWSCTLGTLTCTRSDALAAVTSYPTVIVTVDVASNAPATVTNQATVSGGGETNTANDTASDATAIAPITLADLMVTKTHVGVLAQGQTGATYTLTVSNTGVGPTAGTVTVVDTLPVGLTATAITGTGWTCTLGTQTCTRSDALAAGASYPPVTMTVTVATNAAASVTNQAIVSGGGQTNTANDIASDPTTVTQLPDMTVTKTHVGNFTQGQVGATYTLTVRNSGTVVTSGTVTVVDTLPSTLTATALSGTGWSCTLGTLTCTRSDALAAGTNYPVVTLTVNVASTAPASVTNQATVSGGGETNTANDTASNPTTITQLPDLTVTKTHAGVFSQGQTGATYTLTVRNTGTGATSGAVTLVDTLPNGLTATALSGTGWTCTLGTRTCTRSNALAAGASYPVVTVTVTVASTAPATVTNQATVSGGGQTNTANDAASDPTTITQLPDVTVTKTHAGTFTQGQTGGTYTLTVNNIGSVPTSGAVTVVDTLPGSLTATAIAGTGWSCILGTRTCTRSDALAAGTSYPTLTVTVDVAATAPASVTNQATVSGGGETNMANDTASDATAILQLPDMTLTKTHAGGFTQGQTGATYTLTARNAGTGATNGAVTVVDTLPGDLTATTLAGTGWSCTLGTLTCTRSDVLAAGTNYPAITLTVSVASAAAASVTNQATVSGGGETNTANNSAGDPTTIAPATLADLTVTKTHAGAFTQGQTGATYTVTVNNIGTGPTGGVVTVVDTLPTGLTATALAGTGWSCTLGTLTCTRSDALAAGTNYPTVTVTVTVANTAPASVANQATVSGGGETNTANDTASDATAITQLPDVTVTKTHAGVFTQGQTGAAYTLTVRNSGAGPTSGAVSVVDTLPAGLTATALTGTGWNCTLGTLTCTRSDALAAGTNYPAVTVTVTVASTAPGSVTNQATVSGGGETNTANNTASDPTTIASPTSGLVAAYSFNEGIGTSTTDASGTGNTGNIVNATWTAAGKYGGALSFNGAATVNVSDATSLRLTTAMTLEAWVNPSAVTSGWRDVIYKANDNYYLEATTTNSSFPAAAGTFGAVGAEAYGTAALAPNVWVHLAGTYDGATLRLYVNGTQVTNLARTGNITTSTNPLQIGGDSLYGQFFSGLIDEVRVYNVAKTAAEIQTDMNTPIGAGPPDTQPPTAPSGLLATAVSGSQIDLTWTASIDNVAVSAYLIERCVGGAGCTPFVQLPTTPTGTTFSDTGLPTATTYSYRARATDAAGNVSVYSNVASAITPAPDGQPPSAPGTLTATPLSGTQVNLSWVAATDNVGVTGYRVERCQGAGCSDFVKLTNVTPIGTTATDLGLLPNTTYNYVVRAMDAAGNIGPYGNVASVTTLATLPELVAAYSFNEGTGSTVLDGSGNGNTGTIVNAVWTGAGKFGSALIFNGGNARITVPDAVSLHLSTGMTLEAWVYPTAVTSGWRDVIYKANDIYYLEATSVGVGAPAAGGTFAPSTLQGATALAAGVWSHLAATYDGANLRLYVNGVQAASTAQTGNILSSGSPVEIGGDSLFGQFFQGQIDEVRIYNVALTPTQIQVDMNTPVGGTVPVVNLSVTNVNFGTRAIGITTGAITFALTNIGGAPLTFNGVTISGTNSADFARTHTCPASIAAGNGCTISVTFTPGAAGARSASLSIQDSASGSPQMVPLAGTGVAVLVSPTVATLTLGQTQQFVATTAGSSSFLWSVDGVSGGSSTSGTITPAGLYMAPAAAGSHTITATTTDLSKSGNAAVSVVNYTGTFTFHNDKSRTGLNQNETVLTTTNVNSATFGKAFSYTIDGHAVASPLYVPAVNVPGQGVRNVVFVATEHDSVYAFDADGVAPGTLWQRSFINPAAGITTIPASDTGECCDIAPEIGITSTPVIDPATGTLYVVAKTKEVVGGTTNYIQRLHALDLTTGAEKFGGPMVIQATVPGNGVDSVGGFLTFRSFRENQRTALLLNNGVLYMSFGSHGDIQPYHGWVLAYNPTTLQQVWAYCVTPNGEGGGVWQGGGGLTADAAGNIYFISSDGTFDANTGGVDLGDSYIKMSPAGVVLDYFTPHNQAALDAGNVDLGAGGLLLLPDQAGTHPHVMLSAGKNGTIHVIDRDNMGHYNASNDNQAVQTLQNIFPFGNPELGNFSAAAYFNGYVYFSPIADNLQAFRVTNGLLSTAPTSRSPELFTYPGGTIAVSSSGVTNGIVWAVQINGTSGAGVLRAYNAGNLGIELYNSSQAGTRDTLDPAAKFSVPLIANGKVFVASSGRLTAFGLLP